jgi:hypothetical protein
MLLTVGFLVPDPEREPRGVNLEEASYLCRFVQSKMVVTQSPSIFRPLQQSLPRGN